MTINNNIFLIFILDGYMLWKMIYYLEWCTDTSRVSSLVSLVSLQSFVNTIIIVCHIIARTFAALTQPQSKAYKRKGGMGMTIVLIG
jgi:hypothetical protein